MVHLTGILLHGITDIPMFSIYCPPNSDPNDMFNIVNKYDFDTIIIAGDFNITHENWGGDPLKTNNIALDFCDKLLINNYNIANNGNPTHFNHHTMDTCIDVTLIKNNNNIDIIEWDSKWHKNTLYSDHYNIQKYKIKK